MTCIASLSLSLSLSFWLFLASEQTVIDLRLHSPRSKRVVLLSTTSPRPLGPTSVRGETRLRYDQVAVPVASRLVPACVGASLLVPRPVICSGHSMGGTESFLTTSWRFPPAVNHP